MTHRFAAVGRCIYCGTSEAGLSDEHVVPYAMSGQLILPNSSCLPCAKVTGAFIERSVIRGLFDKTRSRHKIQSRRMKRRPTHSKIVAGVGDGAEIIEFPVSQLPSFSWTLPLFGCPGLFFDAQDDHEYASSIEFRLGARDAKKLLDLGGGHRAVTLQPDQIDLRLFQRMLAKIAHSFATATLGDNFEPYLNDFILTGSGQGRYWIGSEDIATTTPESTVWSVDLGDFIDASANQYICVRIRFFGVMNTPVYTVVVGRPRVPPISFPSPRGFGQAASIVAVAI